VIVGKAVRTVMAARRLVCRINLWQPPKGLIEPDVDQT